MTKMPKQIQPILSWREIWVLVISGQIPILRSSVSRFDGKGIVQQNTIETSFQMISSNSPLILLQCFWLFGFLVTANISYYSLMKPSGTYQNLYMYMCMSGE